MILTKVDKAYYVFLGFATIVLFYIASGLAISYKEALLFYNDQGIVGVLARLGCGFFGNSNISLRLPFILFSLLNLILLYHLSKDYFRYSKDRLYTLVVFFALPGVLSASVLVHEAIIVIFITLVYLAWFKKFGTHNWILLLVALFIDNSFAVLFLGLVIYALWKRDKKLFIYTLLLFVASLYWFGFDSGGKPKGHFLETMGVFATIFSPLLFIYFFYSMYTVPLRKEQNLLWFVSFSALILAIILSLRQKIAIGDFAPFVVIAIPFMMKLFLHSMRVRLAEYRTKYYLGSYAVLGVLFANSLMVTYAEPLYLVLSKPQNHFAFDYHFADEIAASLKKQHINAVYCEDEELQLRLKFYGIGYSTAWRITTQKPYQKNTIKFFIANHIIYGVTVTKINR